MIKPEEVKEIVISSTKTTETETPTPSIDVSNRPYKRYHIGIQAGFYKAVLGGVNFRYSSTPVLTEKMNRLNLFFRSVPTLSQKMLILRVGSQKMGIFSQKMGLVSG